VLDERAAGSRAKVGGMCADGQDSRPNRLGFFGAVWSSAFTGSASQASDAVAMKSRRFIFCISFGSYLCSALRRFRGLSRDVF